MHRALHAAGVVYGRAVHRLCLRPRYAGRPHRPHDRNDKRFRTRIRLIGRRRVVRRRASDPVVPVGPATTRSFGMGGGLSLRRRGRGQARALQHPVRIPGQALFRRHAESRRSVCACGDRVRLPAGIPERGALAGGAGYGDHPSLDDGQHDSLPELQDLRPANAPKFRGSRSRRPRSCAARGGTPVRARRHGLYVLGLGLHRLRLDATPSSSRWGGRRAAGPTPGHYATGSVISTVFPLSRSLVIEIVPPLSSTFRLAIGRPSPVPAAFVEK